MTTRIFAILPSDLHRRVELTLPRGNRVERATIATLAGAFAVEPGGILIVDPTAISTESASTIVECAARTNGRILLYSRLNSRTCAMALAATGHATVGLVLVDEHDEAACLRRHLATLLRESVTAHLFTAMSARITALPEPTRTHAVGLFGRNAIPSTDEFLRQVAVPPRTIRRWCHRVGIRGVSYVIGAVQLARALDDIWNSPSDLERAAIRLGMNEARALRRKTMKAIGVSARSLNDRLNPRAAAERIAQTIIVQR